MIKVMSYEGEIEVKLTESTLSQENEYGLDSPANTYGSEVIIESVEMEESAMNISVMMDEYSENGDKKDKMKKTKSGPSHTHHSFHVKDYQYGNGDGVFPFWTEFTEMCRSIVCNGLVALSVCAAKHPKTTLCLVPMVSFGLLGIGFFTNFELILDQMVAFSPVDSIPEKHSAWLRETPFRNNTNDETKVSRTLFLMVIHADDENILTRDGIEHVFDAIDAVKSLPGYNDICTGNYTLWKGCESMSVAKFWDNDRTTFETSVSPAESGGDDEVAYVLSHSVFKDGVPVDLGQIVDTDSANYHEKRGRLKKVRAYFIYWLLVKTDQTPTFERRALKRIQQLQKQWDQTSRTTRLTVTASTSNVTTTNLNNPDDEDNNNDNDYDNDNEFEIEAIAASISFPDEFLRAILNDLPLLPVVTILMIGFTCLVFYRHDRVESRTMLGVGSVVTIFLSVCTGFGIMFLCGVPYTNMTTMLPFVIVGIGLDDTFIITGHFFRTSHIDDPIQRLRHTISTVGMSIFVTSVTTSLAFMLGLISRIPAVYWVCLYAFTTIMIDFFYQITYFVAILILDERRVRANRTDCLICCVVPQNKNDDMIDEKNNSTDDDDKNDDKIDDNSNTDDDKKIPDDDNDGDNVKQDHDNDNDNDNGNDADNKSDDHEQKYVDISIDDTENPERFIQDQSFELDEKEQHQIVNKHTSTATSGGRVYKKTIPDRIMCWYANQLMRPVVKALVIAAFLLLLSVCTWRTTLLKQDFEPIDLLADDSYAKAYYETYERYNERSIEIRIVFRYVNQSDPLIQQQMTKFIDDLVDLEYFGKQPTYCWVKDFQEFIGTEGYLYDMPFEQRIDSLLSLPLIEEVYGKDFAFDGTGTIVASRCKLQVYHLDISDIHHQMEFMRDVRRVTQQQPINEGKSGENNDWPFFTYDPSYKLFEFYLVHVRELISTTVAGIFAVTLVTFFFTPHWTAFFFVLPMMTTLYIDLLGILQLCGIHMNVVTFVILVVSIGLLVDFVIHVLLSYYESNEMTREGKVKDALETLGSSIFVGGFSTFLGVVPLAASTSSIIQTVYVCFLAMVLLGVSYGLVLLPVLLSIFGPVKHHHHIEYEMEDEEEDEKNDDDKNGDTNVKPNDNNKDNNDDDTNNSNEQNQQPMLPPAIDNLMGNNNNDDNNNNDNNQNDNNQNDNNHNHANNENENENDTDKAAAAHTNNENENDEEKAAAHTNNENENDEEKAATRTNNENENDEEKEAALEIAMDEKESQPVAESHAEQKTISTSSSTNEMNDNSTRSITSTANNSNQEQEGQEQENDVILVPLTEPSSSLPQPSSPQPSSP